METFFQKRSDFYTHVVLDGAKGCWYLPMSNRDAFLSQYVIQDRQWCLAEKPGSTIPIVIDVDLAEPYEGGSLEALYTQEQLMTFVDHCQRVLANTMEECDATCFILEKDPRLDESKNSVKHGFHLHFPNVFVRLDDGKEVFKLLNTFDGFSLDNVIGKCWLMYGSSKSLDSLPYVVTRVAKADGTVYESVELALNDLDEIYACVTNTLTVFERLVRLLSINPIGKQTIKLKHQQHQSMEVIDYIDSSSSTGTSSDDKIGLVELLLPVLKESRSEDYQTWWEIGAIINTESKGSTFGLQLFLAFSRRSEKYDEVVCIEVWDKFKRRSNVKSRKTLGSLLFLCRLDNREETNRILNEWKSKTDVIIPYTEYRIACEFYDFYPETFLYCSQSKWYVFKGHCWLRVTDEYIYFSKFFVELSDWFTQRLQSITDTTDRKNIQNVIRKLETTSSQNGIIRQLSGFYFHSEDLPKILNSNPDLIVFTNGVFDLKLLQFREGRQSDYITKSLPVAYEKPTKMALKNMLQFFEKIFPDEELRSYFFQVVCDVFEGGNQEKIGFFWTGSGNNGKSKTQLLFEKMMGWDLSCKLPTSVLTSGKPKQGCATPELATLHGGVRWTVYDEPDSNIEKIKAGIFKHLTGNDSIFARPLYLKPLQFTPMTKTTIICNTLPLIDGADEATWSRVQVIPFEARFSSRAPRDCSEQVRLKHFPIDKYIERSFDEMSTTLAWYLIEEYKRKRERETMGQVLLVPKKVKNAILNYQVRCDTILKSCEILFIRVDSESQASDPKALYRLLHKHFKIFLPNETISYQLFMQYYNEVIDKGTWYRQRTVNDTQDGDLLFEEEHFVVNTFSI
jgi:P4 family phage/plasmid primase-like protien